MNKPIHKSALSTHYDKESQSYDLFNEKSSVVVNQYLEALFKKYKVKTVLDLACGTGSQVFWLTKKGFQVVGVDINTRMLKLAKEKANKLNLNIKFVRGDMRTTFMGEFDAVVTIFNAIGHLTKQDFKKSIKNVHANLKPNGLYVFDIFNLNYLLEGDNITKLTIDWLKKSNGKAIREIQYSTISLDGILASYDIYHERNAAKAKEKISKAFQTLQVYNRIQLKDILESQGFKVIKQCAIDGSRCNETKTERILTIARKLSG